MKILFPRCPFCGIECQYLANSEKMEDVKANFIALRSSIFRTHNYKRDSNEDAKMMIYWGGKINEILRRMI